MLELLLGSSSFADFVTRYDYLGVIARQDADVYAEIRAEKEAWRSRGKRYVHERPNSKRQA